MHQLLIGVHFHVMYSSLPPYGEIVATSLTIDGNIISRIVIHRLSHTVILTSTVNKMGNLNLTISERLSTVGNRH